MDPVSEINDDDDDTYMYKRCLLGLHPREELNLGEIIVKLSQSNIRRMFA